MKIHASTSAFRRLRQSSLHQPLVLIACIGLCRVLGLTAREMTAGTTEVLTGVDLQSLPILRDWCQFYATGGYIAPRVITEMNFQLMREPR
jgi:hypothetical protein